jgi:hypothetical protein
MRSTSRGLTLFLGQWADIVCHGLIHPSLCCLLQAENHLDQAPILALLPEKHVANERSMPVIM